MCLYYRDLDSDVIRSNKDKMVDGMKNASSTYLSRYRELIDRKINHDDSYLPERICIVLTRWRRLSNHRLKIETERYDPYIKRHLRKCLHCNVVEDEQHALYQCPLYDSIRLKFNTYLHKYPTINKVFNPVSSQDAITLGNYLIEIESHTVTQRITAVTITVTPKY